MSFRRRLEQADQESRQALNEDVARKKALFTQEENASRQLGLTQERAEKEAIAKARSYFNVTTMPILDDVLNVKHVPKRNPKNFLGELRTGLLVEEKVISSDNQTAAALVEATLIWSEGILAKQGWSVTEDFRYMEVRVVSDGRADFESQDFQLASKQEISRFEDAVIQLISSGGHKAWPGLLDPPIDYGDDSDRGQ